MAKDTRATVGTVVYALACPGIVSNSEGHRKFGKRASSTVLEGRVVDVIKRQLKGRTYRYLNCVWSVQGVKKYREVPLGATKIGPDFFSKLKSGIPEREIEIDYPIDEAVSDTENNDTPTPSKRQVLADKVSTPLQRNTGSVGLLTVPPPHASHNIGSVPIECHGQMWEKKEALMPLNGAVPRLPWTVRGPNGECIQEGGAPPYMSPIDYFMWMFPMRHLSAMTMWTNVFLEKNNIRATTAGELLKFFGVLILMTRFKFTSRKDLWNQESSFKYIPAPNFGRFMSYSRFDILRKYICFSATSRETPVSSPSDTRWDMCEEFLNAINSHRQEKVLPSDLLCVDESMSRWYGRGGEWISVGLPHYVAMERKPEAGCEIHDIACGRSGILLGLSFVKAGSDVPVTNEEENLNVGTRVLLHLTAPWAGTGRIVCADSWFASVQSAAMLFESGLRFTGVIKTATKKFPANYFGNLEMKGRGDHASLMTACHGAGNTHFEIIAVQWVDRNRRMFVSTTGSTLPGRVQERMRWRQFAEGARRVHVSLPIPQLVETYYSAAAQIDRHNRCRQDDLDMEKTVEVREWSFRINTTLLSICVVDAWLLFKGGRAQRTDIKPHEFYCTLAEELIDNTYDVVGFRERRPQMSPATSPVKRKATSGAAEHLTPTKKRKKNRLGKLTTYSLQRRCRVCKTKATNECSVCCTAKDDSWFFCHSRTGRSCYADHLSVVHNK